jgi:hypothetical protein
MSPTQPYQSRLFQTVRSQVRHIKEDAQLRWRQLKVATTWGAQVALYPLYTLFQAARWSGQVLKQATSTVTQTLLSFARGEETLAPIDRPIQNVLDAIAFLELPMGGKASPHSLQLSIRPIAKPKSILTVWRKKLSTLWQPWRKAQPSSLISDLSISAPVSLPSSGQSSGQSSEQSNVVSQSIAIRGVASLLVQQRLVLVTSENQILDVLTSEQQRQLHQRIIWEIAQAQYVRRQLGRTRAIPAWKTWQALPIQVRPQWSFPVRAIYHLMAWVQHQPLTHAALMLPPSDSPPALTPHPVLASLRQWWATLLPPSQPFPSFFHLGKGELRGVAQGITHFVQSFGLRQNLDVQNAPLALTGQKPVPILTTIAQKLRGYRTVLVAVAGAIALLPFTLAMPEPAKAAVAPSLPAPLPRPLMVEPFINVRSRRRWQADAKLSEQSGRLSQGQVRIAPQKAAPGLSGTNFEGAIADWAHRFSQTTKAADPSTIEVDAVFMGYDHHPLEVLLLWLDQAIAWVEGQLTRVGDWLFPKLQSWIGQLWQRH